MENAANLPINKEVGCIFNYANYVFYFIQQLMKMPTMEYL